MILNRDYLDIYKMKKKSCHSIKMLLKMNFRVGRNPPPFTGDTGTSKPNTGKTNSTTKPWFPRAWYISKLNVVYPLKITSLERRKFIVFIWILDFNGTQQEKLSQSFKGLKNFPSKPLNQNLDFTKF
jgi:hypothetical protein